MFLGHVAVGLAAKKVAPKTSVATGRRAFVAFTLVLIPLWAGWFDRHRTLRA